ncbi:hypothetical protein ABTX80_37125 [Streptomyces erythrochromogenes]|uniref:hypothetical protein n=1 Tax=Streptomyces erythrochromogenes TaxID=285574 RepID=UPI0033166501
MTGRGTWRKTKTARNMVALVGLTRRLSRAVSEDVCCPSCIALLARGIAGHGHTATAAGRPPDVA